MFITLAAILVGAFIIGCLIMLYDVGKEYDLW